MSIFETVCYTFVMFINLLSINWAVLCDGRVSIVDIYGLNVKCKISKCAISEILSVNWGIKIMI